jgi:hypothetical protein
MSRRSCAATAALLERTTFSLETIKPHLLVFCPPEWPLERRRKNGHTEVQKKQLFSGEGFLDFCFGFCEEVSQSLCCMMREMMVPKVFTSVGRG